MSGQEEPNPKLRLVTKQVGPISPARDYPVCPARTIFMKAKLNRSRWLGVTVFFFWNEIDLDSISVMKAGLISTTLACLICISPQEERLDA